MSTASPCRLLEWDCAFFGRRIATAGAHPLDAVEMERALEWCRDQSIECLFLLVGAGDLATLRLAEQNGFRVVDIRVTYDVQIERAWSDRALPDGIRLARESDIAALRAIASACHTESRFYADGNFERERCDELYATWIEKSCRGWADVVYVADHGGAPAGYLSCHAREGGRGEIGLVGLAAAAQGKGHGRALVQSALRWFSERGLERASVVTQGRNVSAQRLYQGVGFRTAAVQLWHHRWFAHGPNERP